MSNAKQGEFAKKLQTPEYRKARRALIVWDRLHGHTYKTLSEKYQLSEDTIRGQLMQAKKEGLVQGIEERIMGALTNKALALYEKALDEGDLFVAKDVLNHMAKITDRHDKKAEHKEGMTLQLWLQHRKEQQLKNKDVQVLDVQTITEEISHTSSPQLPVPLPFPLEAQINSARTSEADQKALRQNLFDELHNRVKRADKGRSTPKPPVDSEVKE